jgi:hypothetical protein
MLAYMLWAPFPPEHEAAIRHVSWLIFAAGLTSAVLVALHILWSPGVNHPRRTWSLLADIAGIAASMLAGGTIASVFFPLLLWVILGYGFRYGRTYLILAAAGSVAAFSGVLALSPDWRQSPFFDTAMMIALVILPFYFAVLLGKLTQPSGWRGGEPGEEPLPGRHEPRVPHTAQRRDRHGRGAGHDPARRRPARHRGDGAERRAGLLGLVDDVLDLARLEARRFTVDDVPFDLHDLLATVRHLLFHAAAAKGLYLRLRLDPDTPTASGVVPGAPAGAAQPRRQRAPVHRGRRVVIEVRPVGRCAGEACAPPAVRGPGHRARALAGGAGAGLRALLAGGGDQAQGRRRDRLA